MRKKLVNIGLIAILAGAGCGESQRVDNKNVDKVDSRTLENYDLKERLEKTNGADNFMYVIGNAIYNPENIGSVEDYLFGNPENRAKFEALDMSKVSDDSISSCEGCYARQGVDVNLSDDRNFSKQDKLAYFVYKNVQDNIKKAMAKSNGLF